MSDHAILDAVRQRLTDLRDAADRLDKLLAAGNVPPFVLCRVAVAIDTATCELQTRLSHLERVRQDQERGRG